MAKKFKLKVTTTSPVDDSVVEDYVDGIVDEETADYFVKNANGEGIKYEKEEVKSEEK